MDGNSGDDENKQGKKQFSHGVVILTVIGTEFV
jgi:hypothetical protein